MASSSYGDAAEGLGTPAGADEAGEGDEGGEAIEEVEKRLTGEGGGRLSDDEAERERVDALFFRV